MLLHYWTLLWRGVDGVAALHVAAVQQRGVDGEGVPRERGLADAGELVVDAFSNPMPGSRLRGAVCESARLDCRGCSARRSLWLGFEMPGDEVSTSSCRMVCEIHAQRHVVVGVLPCAGD